MKNLKVSYLILAALAAAGSAQADNRYESHTFDTLITVGGGAAFTPALTGSTTVPISDPIVDSFYIYDTNSKIQTLGFFTAFAGFEWTLSQFFSVQAGLEYVRYNHYEVEGEVTQGADIQSENTYDFHYKIMSQQILAESKIMFNSQTHFYPYLLVGMGASFNQSIDFDTDVPPYLTYTQDYETNTIHNFSYVVGVGVDVNVISNLRLGLGYRFTGLGQSKFIEANIDQTEVKTSLTQVNMNYNEVIGQLTWLFN